MTTKTRTQFNGRIGIIEIKGSLIGDRETDEFRAAVADLIEQGNKCLVIDLHKVNYLNSSGIGALISAHTSYAKNGGEVKLIGINTDVHNLLVVTKLIDVFDVYETVNEAIENFSKM